MARHLSAGGFRVSCFDPVAQRMALAEGAGMTAAPSLAELLSASDVIVSSIPNDAALESTVVAVCRHARRGAIYLDTSTVSLDASTRAASSLVDAGIAYVRCTVSGNNQMAEAAQLTALVSGDPQAYQQVADLIGCWGPNCFYLGTGEQARLMKLVLNLMIMATTGMLAESLALGRKGGLSWDDMWSVIGASALGSPIVKAKAGPLSRRDFTPTFTVEQMQKDVGLILGAGKSLQVPLSLTALCAQWLTSAAAQGDSHEDYAAIIKVVEAAAGLDTTAA
jgi:3-hydroxyisobutyrate dehydrogenase